MQDINTVYIDGAFVEPHGTERFDLFNPATEERIGTVRLADEVDADRAVAAARRAFPTLANTSKEERLGMLRRLAGAVRGAHDTMTAVMAEEYGAPPTFIRFSVRNAAAIFDAMATTLADFEFERTAGTSRVTMVPRGVVAAITPWNSNFGFLATKIAHALASGSPIVVKPAEQSAMQTQLLLELLHEADLPIGAVNVVTGSGPVVGAALTAHPGVSMVTFTGSTAGAKVIQRAAGETIKRLVLELGGKSPTVLLDDADLSKAIPIALSSAFANSGQACVAGTRLLAPANRREEVEAQIRHELAGMKVGPSTDPDTQIGPLANAQQWERVQSYIRLGSAEGATLLAGGEGRPDGLERGWFVRPTVFTDVDNRMRIAREEIFGPVLAVLYYEDERQAIEMANDSDFGLQAYVLSSDTDRAVRVAEQLIAGRVIVNGAPHDPLAPFGGFRQSGIGRENGPFGLEEYLEPRAILVPKA